MLQFLAAAILLPLIYVVYTVVQSYVDHWQYVRKSKAGGYTLPIVRPHKPTGYDMVQRIIDADNRRQVPNELEAIFAEQSRSTFRQYFFGQLVIGTCEPRNIQALLATQFKDFEIGSIRRGAFAPLLGRGIFTADGKLWEHSRALLRPQFAREQVSNLEIEEAHVQDMFLHLSVDQSGWTSQVDLQPLFFRLTLDSATQFLFGESVHSLISSLPYDSELKNKTKNEVGMDLTEVGKAFDRAVHGLGKRGRLAGKYWLQDNFAFRKDCRTVHNFADYYVRKALAMDSEKDDDRYIFLAELVKATRDPLELRSQLLNILLAGRDTTAGLLGWTFWELARHPEIFEKLRSIVIETFGTEANPKEISFTTLKGCTYLQHVMSEILRLFPSVPINSRIAVKDTTLPLGGGPDGQSPIFVAAGTPVDYSVHVMHKRKDLWGQDADEFKPERWQGRKAGWEFLPFNGGPRICLGQQFALTEAGYVIVRLLQKFDKIENLDVVPENSPRHQYSVTTAPMGVPLRLHAART